MKENIEPFFSIDEVIYFQEWIKVSPYIDLMGGISFFYLENKSPGNTPCLGPMSGRPR